MRSGEPERGLQAASRHDCPRILPIPTGLIGRKLKRRERRAPPKVGRHFRSTPASRKRPGPAERWPGPENSPPSIVDSSSRSCFSSPALLGFSPAPVKTSPPRRFPGRSVLFPWGSVLSGRGIGSPERGMDFETLGRKDLGAGNWVWNLGNGERTSGIEFGSWFAGNRERGNAFGIWGNGFGTRFRALNCRVLGQVAGNLSSMRTKHGRLSRNDAVGGPVSEPGAGLCLFNGEGFPSPRRSSRVGPPNSDPP